MRLAIDYDCPQPAGGQLARFCSWLAGSRRRRAPSPPAASHAQEMAAAG